MLIVAAVASTPWGLTRWRRMENRGLQLAVLGLGLLACTAYVVAGTYNPFLYFRF